MAMTIIENGSECEAYGKWVDWEASHVVSIDRHDGVVARHLGRSAIYSA
jgi:hypothetical protein